MNMYKCIQTIIKEVMTMTLEKQLKHYITDLFSLPQNEAWECEAIDEVSDNILPDQYVRLGPLTNKILHTYTGSVAK